MAFALLFHYLLLNMFRILVHPSSGACDLLWIYCSGSMCVGVMVWFGWGGVVYLCRLKHYCFSLHKDHQVGLSLFSIRLLWTTQMLQTLFFFR